MGQLPMDPKHTGELLKHLEKQNELLIDAYKSISHELHRLQVEEEMLMRKYYELMVAERPKKKNDKESADARNGKAEDDQAGTLACVSDQEKS